MKKTTCTTIDGKPVELTAAQVMELRRDGMVVVGDRIIRTGTRVARVHGKAGEPVAETAKRVFR